MLRHRVIPALLLRNGGLVKTTRFKDARYLGDPLNAVRIFNEKEVDELLVLDISASREKRGPDYDVITQFATECFMPFCYGGGISTLDQADRLFNLGVEKISIQTAIRDDLDLVAQISSKYGSQAVVASVDIKSIWMGGYALYWSTTEKMEKDWVGHLRRVVDAGAGEVLINAVDLDGTMEGMDIKLIGQASKIIPVPLIAMGGVGSIKDIGDGINAGASAVAAGSFFVFHGRHRAVLISYPDYKSLEAALEVPT